MPMRCSLVSARNRLIRPSAAAPSPGVSSSEGADDGDLLAVDGHVDVGEPRVGKPAGEPVGSVVGGRQVGCLPAAPATEVAPGSAVSAAARAASAAFVLVVLGCSWCRFSLLVLHDYILTTLQSSQTFPWFVPRAPLRKVSPCPTPTPPSAASSSPRRKPGSTSSTSRRTTSGWTSPSDDATFGSVTTIRFESRGGETFLDLKPVRVNAIRLNGEPVDVDLLRAGRRAAARPRPAATSWSSTR